MSEFELVYLLNEMEATLWTHMMNYVSIIFAMLVTAYLIGPKLNRMMTITIITLFSIASFLFSGSVITARQDYIEMAGFARELLEATTSSIPPLNIYNAPAASIVAMNMALVFILVFGYAATLVFFFQARKRAI